MVWKRRSSQKISGLITALVVSVFCLGLQAREAKLEAVSHYDKEIKKSNQKLDVIKAEIEKGRQKLSKLQNDEGNFLEQLNQIEKNIASTTKYLKAVSHRIDTVETVLEHLNDSLKRAENNLQNRQKLMRSRLKQAYMQRSPHLFVTLFNANSPLDAVNKVKYLEKVNSYDRELVRQIATSKIEIDNKKKLQTLELEHLSQLQKTKAAEVAAQQKQEEQRKEMLTDVRKEKSSFEAMVKELENSQKELVSMIKLLEKNRKKAKTQKTVSSVASFEKRKGVLPWPVEGPVVTVFGKVVHPEYQTVTMSNGIDIKAKKGEPVHCVAAGTVIHTGWLRGLGNMVIVDHVGGYLSIYAHLEEISVAIDQTVKAESVLGKVGETGSIGGVKMHFEIRKSSLALNPAEWLEKR